MSTDRIEKQVVLHASLERVWRAISDSNEFGSWFGVRFDGPFSPGAPLVGTIVPTSVDPEVAKSQEAYAGAKFNITVESVEPMRLFSFRWHPFAVEEGRDYSIEPTTLVSFELEENGDGVLLTLTESGFDSIPADRRATAFSMNEGGWSAQMQLIQKYLAKAG